MPVSIESNIKVMNEERRSSLPMGNLLIVQRRPLWYGLYFLFATLALLLYRVRSLLKREWRLTAAERCALPSVRSVQGRGPVWFHGASLGEIQGIVPVVEEWLARAHEPNLLVTTTSRTGQIKVRELFPQFAGGLLPFDHPLIVSRWIRRVQPRLLVLFETELWPALIIEMAHQGVPVVVVNGRISDRTFPRYLRGKALVSDLLARITWIAAMSESDRERFIRLGMSADRVTTYGSTKFDINTIHLTPEAISQLRSEAKLGQASRIFVAGSVRPGEDRQVIKAFGQVRKQRPDVAMVLAPRHPEKSAHLDALLQAVGLSFYRRSQLCLGEGESGPADVAEVLILDTLGELQAFYQIATVVFIGGTLVPVGGHNPFEPIAYGKPVIIGPWTQNVRDAVRMLIDQQGIIEVQSPEQLTEQLGCLLDQAVYRSGVAENGRRVLTTQQGAVARVTSALEQIDARSM